MITCSWKSTFGFDCPGCGFQRSFLKLFEGEFYESVMLYPATLPILITFLLLILHLRYKFQEGAYTLVGTFLISTILILVNFLSKLLI